MFPVGGGTIAPAGGEPGTTGGEFGLKRGGKGPPPAQ
jgi:hypothetical protein